MFVRKFDGTDDYFDSRDVVERIEELISEFVDATESDPADIMSVDDWKFGLTEEDAEELAALIAFREEEDGNYGDSFEDGITFLHADHFVDAMKELCEDIGYLPEGAPDWLVINWEETADNLRADYRSSTFRGGEYWAR